MNWQQIQATVERAGGLLTTEEKRRLLIHQRQCKAVRKDGAPCGNQAMWESAEDLCRRHSPPSAPDGKPQSKRPRCTCRAYAFPHRPLTGNCRWPAPPLIVSDKPAGTRRAKMTTQTDSEAGRAAKMAQTVTDAVARRESWFMSGRKMRAAFLLIDGEMSTQQIAEVLRVSKRTLLRWKKHQVFVEFWRKTEAEMCAKLSSGR